MDFIKLKDRYFKALLWNNFQANNEAFNINLIRLKPGYRDFFKKIFALYF